MPNNKTKQLTVELIEKLGADGRASVIIELYMAQAELSGFTEANDKLVEILKKNGAT